MKTSKLFLPIIFIPFAVVFILFLGNVGQAQEQPHVKDGSISFDSWDFRSQGTVSLEGEWKIYWDELVTHEMLENTDIEPEVLHVPLLWSKIDRPEGFATYRLLITGLVEGEIYSLKMMDFHSAYSMWLDGREVASAGVVGKTAEQEQPQFNTQRVTFIGTGQTTELLIQISNFHFREGGIWFPPTIGLVEQVQQAHTNYVAFEYMLFASLILVGVIHIGQYINRRKDKVPLWFGLFCIAISLRSIAVGEIILVNWFPEAPMEVVTKFSYFWYYISVPFFSYFLYYMFREEASERVTKINAFLGFIFSSLVLMTPAIVYSNVLIIYNSITVVVIIYFLVVLLNAVKKNRRGSVLMLFCYILFASTVIFDILVAQNVVYGKPLTAFGLLIFVFAQSYVTFSKQSRAFREVETIREQLKEANESLDEKIRNRTKELEDSQQQLLTMNEQLRKLSYLDGLTNVANRRLFDKKLSEQWDVSNEKKESICLLLLDVDYFKLYNDEYGHLSGDDCLKQIALVLQNTFNKKSQLVARFGGEEFAILLPNTARSEAVELANRCRKDIEDQEIPHTKSLISNYVTVSIGVASVVANPNKESTFLIREADTALYLAKENGRNTVVTID
ncbi:diguanylate cyclase [Bacillus alkalicellulosilyticus]|uniref:sensor domain-containing diguanylate cyclase n=1 Tax=Alkalihalobacterium alkalicellulosilyticum TaxID=1912214 RepID=UPI000997DFF9|nr:diguanylate cyclase [Bacillus alkalicellulosilyticus]